MPSKHQPSSSPATPQSHCVSTTCNYKVQAATLVVVLAISVAYTHIFAANQSHTSHPFHRVHHVDTQLVVVSDEVRQALLGDQAVVALESTIISHGMPYPRNVETARQVEQVVRHHGAVPATIAIIQGRIHIGTNQHTL
jgi:hypothetical protein